MNLGEKLRNARQEAGFSQRQLCGDRITRNMLSQIESGAASPSVTTLRYLAERLGKPVSYFLDEDGAVSPNLEVMEDARKAFDRGRFGEAAAKLRDFREPDPIFRREWELLRLLTALALAEKALEENRQAYARELLEEAEGLEARAAYALPELKTRRILLQAKLPGARPEELAAELPDLDKALLLRARAALEGGDSKRCAQLLDAARNRGTRTGICCGAGFTFAGERIRTPPGASMPRRLSTLGKPPRLWSGATGSWGIFGLPTSMPASPGSLRMGKADYE